LKPRIALVGDLDGRITSHLSGLRHLGIENGFCRCGGAGHVGQDIGIG
jgi:hypothetical protein